MAKIQQYLDNIKNALFGREVRGSIHDGIEAINKEVERTTAKQEHLDGTFNQLIINSGTSNAEIVDARVGENGKSYAKLGDRLDEVDSQLEHNINNLFSTNSIPILSNELQDTINNSKGVVVIDKEFIINETIYIPSNTRIEGRKGGKLIFNIDGSHNGLKIIGDNVVIKDLKIDLDVTGYIPHGGYGNALVIGDYRSGDIQTFNNIKIQNCVFDKIGTQRNQGCLISIFNGCHNIELDNVTTDGGQGILVHWSGDFDESDPHESPATKTFHPYNIKIKNYKYLGIGHGIYLSGCYNIEVDNYECLNPKSAVQIFCGDYAQTLATQHQKPLIGKNIVIKNVYCENPSWHCFETYGLGNRWGDVENTTNRLDSFNVRLENIVCVSGSKTPTNKSILYARESKGVYVDGLTSSNYDKCDNIYIYNSENINIKNSTLQSNTRPVVIMSSKNINIENCILKNLTTTNYCLFVNMLDTIKNSDITINNVVFEGGLNGINISNTDNIKIINSSFKNHHRDFIYIKDNNKNLLIEGCKFYDGGMYNSGIYNVIVLNCNGGIIKNNTFYKNTKNVQFNVNIQTGAFNIITCDNISYGLTYSGCAMLFQGTRSDRSNYFYNNIALNGLTLSTFKNYYTIALTEI